MGKPKDIALKPQVNRFAVLADSDDEYPDYAPMSPKIEAKEAEAEVEGEGEAEVEGEGEGEVDADADADAEKVQADTSSISEKSEQFRVWKTEEKRFDTTNIFSSPFSHKKKKEWVSIQEFPSLLTRGDEEAAAHAWAEKVKSTLEKAGQQRKSLSFFRRIVDDKF